MWLFGRKKKNNESQQAVLDAVEALRDVKSRDEEVHEVSGALRYQRERNHFAEQLRVIMERG